MNFQGGHSNSRNFNGPGGNSSLLNSRGPNSNNGALFNNGPQNRLNPWEPGVTPGVGPGPMGNVGNIVSNRVGGGLLPTPNLLGSGLLQQPASTQNVQLAVANNVLSYFLPNNMQQSQQQNQISPLIGHNSNRGGLLPLNFPNQSFGGQGSPQQSSQGPNNFRGQSNQNNVGPNRPRPLLTGRRPEPYNKMGNRNQREGTSDNRKDLNNFSRNAGRNAGPSPKNFNQQARKETKRDSRTEKKVESTAKEDKFKESDDVDIEKVSAAYADLPPDLLYCHVCSMKMSDAISYARHIKGKDHSSIISNLEEKYRKETENRRRDMKVEELQRQKAETNQRHGRPVPSTFREYCTMCNLQFYGNLTVHRKSAQHQTLKSFLHPTCQLCSKEFSARIDYDHHLLSAGHLIARNERNHQKQTVSIDCKKSPPVEQTIPKVDKKTDVAPDNVKKTIDPKKSPKLENKKELAILPTPSKIPNFDAAKEIGMELLQEKTGYLCRCCNRFLSSSADAKTHCRSRFHYDKYVAHMNIKANQSEKVTESQMSANTRESKPSEEKSKDVLEPEDDEEDEEDEGNWKRRKIVKEDSIAINIQNENNKKHPEEQVNHKPDKNDTTTLSEDVSHKLTAIENEEAESLV